MRALNPGGDTLANVIAQRIQEDILTGQLLPGERLRTKALCDRFEVSLSVVREALAGLAEKGLVVSKPQLGFAVMTLDAGHLVQLTEARVELETIALRWSIERGGLAWETGIVGSVHALNRTPRPTPGSQRDDVDRWSTAHNDFHAALVDGCGNEVLLALRSQLFDATELYRRSFSLAEHALSPRDVEAEHQAIAEAATRRDEDVAVRLLREHLERTTARLLETGLVVHAAAADRRRP